MKNKILIAISVIVSGMLSIPLITKAAADATLVNAVDDMTGSVQDNVMGTIFTSANLLIFGSVAIGFILLGFVFRFLRRHAK